MDFNLNLPIKVISGYNSLLENSRILASFGEKCLIVTGGTSAEKSGALDDVLTALEKEGIEGVIFNKIGPNPRLDHCLEGGSLAREIGAEFIIGIGGGSPLDAAKAVAVYAANPSFSMTDIYSSGERNKALPLVLIGTTSGTGSEVGKVSVLTNPETNRKKSIAYDDCYPSLTFADPKYTHSMPYDITVSTALDAMAHALEGYMSSKCSDIPTLFGEKAVGLIWEGLTYLYEKRDIPSEQIREKLYYGSLYAGITLAYCGTAFPHPLGYILTENYGIAHGTACAVFMEDFFLRSTEYVPEKAKRILSVMKTDRSQFIKIINALTHLPEIRMTQAEIDSYCSRFDVIPNNFKFTPGSFTKENAIRVLKGKFLSE